MTVFTIRDQNQTCLDRQHPGFMSSVIQVTEDEEDEEEEEEEGGLLTLQCPVPAAAQPQPQSNGSVQLLQISSEQAKLPKESDRK